MSGIRIPIQEREIQNEEIKVMDLLVRLLEDQEKVEYEYRRLPKEEAEKGQKR